MSPEAMTITQPRSPLGHRRRPVLWQPQQPVFWLWLVLTVPSAVLLIVDVVRRTESVAGLAAATVLVGAQGAVLWLLIRAIPRFRRQPLSLRLAALLWGGTFAIMAASALNTVNSDALDRYGLTTLSASISAPLNEDLLRFLGILVVLVLAYGRRITVMDGVLYGFLVGAGFELVENLCYALQSTDVGETLGIGLARLLVGFALHALWSAFSGAVLAYCLSRTQQRLGGRWLLLIPAILAPMLLHAAWDSPPLSVISAVQLLLFILLYGVTLALFCCAVAWGRRSEFVWYTETTGWGGARRDFARLPRSERRALGATAIAQERDQAEASIPAA
ncbi:PrsW family intramembrane metalloprotease [Leucobacter sp. VD1]|uniref:PrsW family intramembrane metalloprotease n=1 Tax=Leucobacter sp. VD1 TaxID=3080381 RepID=UPI003017A280